MNIPGGTNVSSSIKSAALALLLALCPVASVLALHELDHRYDITGFVLDADRQPIAGVPVVAHLGSKTMGNGRSDSDGQFRFRLHLHDSDVGRELRLKTPEHQGTVRVTLTPGDSSTERIHHVNFIDGKLVEGELPGRGGVSNTAAAAVAGAVVLLATFFGTRQFRRMRKRRLRAEQKSAQRKGAGSSKRRKRRKRGR